MTEHHIAAILLLALIGCGITSCGLGDKRPKADVLSCSLGNNPLELVLTVATGPGIDLIPSVVDENDEQVTVEVALDRPDEPTEDVLIQAKVSMVLDDPLGSRRLVGPEGQPIACTGPGS